MPAKSRLAPKASTLRRLYAHSGNLCANPGCSTVLVNANGSLVAAVCHIAAAKKGGPRFDASLTPEQRRQFDNLILLCRTCHALVDAEPERYSVVTLAKWKRERESQFKSVGQTLRRHYLAAISDDADTIGAFGPRTLKRYVEFLDDDNIGHELDDADTLRDTIDELENYVGRIRHLSSEDRQLLAAVIAKALVLDQTPSFASGLAVHPDDLKTIRSGNRNLSGYRVGRLGEALERHNLGFIEPDEPSLRVSDPADHVPWIAIDDFLRQQASDVSHLLIHLDFSVFD
ncbi:MAG: HNH endonuclease signature motif containing protein [Boseongicola sp.]|nr:HNH endonuclease signature motif containing protein [Boseongicola sp.]